MFVRLRKLYQLLTVKQRKALLRLQLLVLFTAISEVFSVAIIAGFMAIISNFQLIEDNSILSGLKNALNIENNLDYIVIIGILVLLILTFSTIASIYTIWRVSMYAAQIGEDLATRLYSHYMHQPWIFHSDNNSSRLTSKIASESNRVTNQIIHPVMQMNAKLVMSFVMFLGIFAFDPYVATIGLFVFGFAYISLFYTVRSAIIRNGIRVTDANRSRFQLMNEGFGGMKDILVLGRQSDFTRRFADLSQQFGRAQGTTKGLAQAPRYAMELLAYTSLIALVIFLIENQSENLRDALPILTVYALAGFKLLPAFQQIYTGVISVRSNMAAFDSLEEDLRASQITVAPQRECSRTLKLYQEIRLDSVSFTYPGRKEAALVDLDVVVPVNKIIGFVGLSGSGKSTAIDVFLGLIEPQKGDLKVDGAAIVDNNRRSWQNNIGYVPQNIFLADASIRENIAFGIPDCEIDNMRIERAANLARLEEFLIHLPHGLMTRVGERGVQLSGGQRQRIGIARALYNDAQVLLLDEATSALDGFTEKQVMDAIHDFSGEKTIILVAHRLSTIERCEKIYLFEDGRIADSGTYQDLILRNMTFRKMAHSH